MSSACSMCGGTGRVPCDLCYGYGKLPTEKSGVLKKCPKCDDGLQPCPKCKGKVEQLAESIYEKVMKRIDLLDSFNEKERDRIKVMFKSMLYLNNQLNFELELAQKECERKSINRHDRAHALQVCEYAIELFDFFCLKPQLDNPRIKPQLMEETIGKVSASEALLSVLIAAYCHDLGRAYRNHDLLSAILWREENLNLTSDLRKIVSDRSIEMKMTHLITKCILNHQAKEKVYSIEESIIIVSDCLDCDENRIQPGFDFPYIFRFDPSPIDFLSCKDITRVQIIGEEDKMKIFLTIKGHASFKQIEELRKSLENTIFTQNSRRHLLEVIINNVNWQQCGWMTPGLTIWPRENTRWIQ